MRMNQTKAGITLSYLIIFISNIINIIFTPIILRLLGQAEYGLYALIGSLVSYIAILDFGLGNTIIRYIAKYRTENDKYGQENFLALTIFIYLTLALLVAIVGLFLYSRLDSIFKNSLSISEINEAQLMFLFMIGNIVFSLPMNSFNAILTGYEKFIFPRLISIVRIFIRTGLVLLFLFLGYKAIAIVVIDTILNVFILIINMLYCLNRLKIKIRFHFFDKPLFKEVLNFSFFIFLSMIVDQIYWRLGQVILGIVASTTLVAIYAIGMQFVNYYIQFSTSISSIFLPRATQIVTNKGSNEELTDLMIKTGRIQFIVLGYILVAFALFGKTFTILWAGKDYYDSWIVGLLILVPLTIPLFQNVGIMILQAKNLHYVRSIILIGVSIINIIVTVFMAKKYGTIGAASGTVISLILGNIIAINMYYKKIGINIRILPFRNSGFITIMKINPFIWIIRIC